MNNYKNRILDSILLRKLQSKGAILIEGPKWCGKTTTAEKISASKIMLSRTDVKNNFQNLLEIDIDTALKGDTPMLIADGKPGPLGVVHLPLDGADGGKAGGAQQVKDHEAVGSHWAEVQPDELPDFAAGLA